LNQSSAEEKLAAENAKDPLYVPMRDDAIVGKLGRTQWCFGSNFEFFLGVRRDGTGTYLDQERFF